MHLEILNEEHFELLVSLCNIYIFSNAFQEHNASSLSGSRSELRKEKR